MSDQSRTKILSRLQNTMAREEVKPSSSGFQFLKKYNQPLLQTFEEKLTNVSGIFIPVVKKEDFKHKFQQFIKAKNISSVFCCENNIAELLGIELAVELNDSTEASVTGCEFLVAQTGSAILSTTQTHSRRTFAYAPIHIIVAFKGQLIGQLEEGLNFLAEKYKTSLPSQITTITGPSRTADIEKTLVLGAHGPKELIIFYIDE